MMVTLFGSGKTTKAIAKKLKEAVFFEDIDQKFRDEEGFWHYPTHTFDPNSSSLEIPSPGIPPSHPLIKRAKNLISEYDFFAKEMPFSIWISGTNGKTTTTQMVFKLLKDKKAEAGGNLGKPLATMNRNSRIWILETSSFTLHYTKTAFPDIYVLLPITPDHLSWHGDLKSYEESKLKPLKSMREGDLCIVPSKYSHVPTAAMKITYADSADLARYFGIDISKLSYEEPFLLDAVMAMAVDYILFERKEYSKINSFEIESHKLEEFKDAKGRVWIDDSKATNVDAAIWALRRYKNKKIKLIAGGDAKGADLEPLAQEIAKSGAELFAIGKDGETLYSLSLQKGAKAHLCKELSEAVKSVDAVLDSQSVGLLSPGCASLDQFGSYKERGERFKKLVMSLR